MFIEKIYQAFKNEKYVFILLSLNKVTEIKEDIYKLKNKAIIQSKHDKTTKDIEVLNNVDGYECVLYRGLNIYFKSFE